MKPEEEKRFAVLAAIIALGGKGRKDQVLDSVAANGHLAFDAHDLESMPNRNELFWRNDLAFVRKHLVKNQHLKGSERNNWEVTEKGLAYFERLCTTIRHESIFNKLSPAGIAHARQVVGA